jgi:hypothetical protein
MDLVGIRKLCTPALIYLILSMITLAVMALQNIFNVDTYCLGNFECQTTNAIWLIFVIKFIYVLFWTWILNLICKAGYTNVSWFLLLIPYILFFIIIMTMMMG